jgi:hypothetical protein
VLSAVVAGQEGSAKRSPQAGDDEVVGLHFPHTAEDHLAIANDYVKLAADHRKEADLHRRMLAAYERFVADLSAQPVPPQKRGKTFPSGKRAKPSQDPLAEYRAHCEPYIRGAEVLADEAEKLAEFHRDRARELRDARDP